MEAGVDVGGEVCLRVETGGVGDYLVDQLKFEQAGEHHYELFGVDKFCEFIEIDDCEMLVEVVQFGFTAHVADGVGDGAGVGLRGCCVVILPMGFDLVDDGEGKVGVFVEGTLGGFLE